MNAAGRARPTVGRDSETCGATSARTHAVWCAHIKKFYRAVGGQPILLTELTARAYAEAWGRWFGDGRVYRAVAWDAQARAIAAGAPT